jgi:hypothetical protein
MEENLIFLKMEDDLKFCQEDYDFNFFFKWTMEDHLNIFENVNRPQFVFQMEKTTSISFQIEDDLNIPMNRRQPQKAIKNK